ncbi:hypothetical protein EVA_09808, partial [gut metagenome]
SGVNYCAEIDTKQTLYTVI